MNIPLIYKPKFIKHYEHLYGVTRMGLIYGFKRWKYSRGSKASNGYMLVRLSHNSIQHSYYVHRLVAQAFIPNPDNLAEVNHKDEDKTNNYYKNLEWCTRKYNNSYGSRNKRDSEIKQGKGNPRARAVLCVELNCMFDTLTEASKWCNGTTSGVCIACKNNTLYKGFHWIYI